MSEFATALSGLLDDTDLFTRPEWAKFLMVSQDTMCDWVRDITIPRPHDLSMILLCVRKDAKLPQEPLRLFDEMAQKRATEISRLGARMLPTVKAYMDRPAFSMLQSVLAKLSPEQQELLLLEIYDS